MIIRSPHTIASRTILIGELTDNGNNKNLEVRLMKERECRPRILVLIKGWEEEPLWGDVFPVLEVQFEPSKNKRGFSVSGEFFSNELCERNKQFLKIEKLKRMMKEYIKKSDGKEFKCLHY